MGENAVGDNLYNEVLVNPKTFTGQLLGSVAAFVYNLGGGSNFGPEDFDNTAQFYLDFLKQYNLSRIDVPLLRAEYNIHFDPDSLNLSPESARVGPDGNGIVFTDMS